MDNLALNKPVSVNSEHSSYPKKNAVDGNNSTLWVSTVLGSARTSWCVVDLQSNYIIKSIELVVQYGCTVFDIETSKDGSVFTPIKKDLNINVNSSKIFPIDNVICRYIKINNIGTSYSSTANQGFAELRVHGDEVKYSLIKSNSKIYTYIDNDWQEMDLTEPVSKSDFENYGIVDLSIIPREKWNELDNEFEILTWTLDGSPRFINIDTELFSPLEKLNNEDEFEVLAYSEKEFKAPKLELTVNEYKPIMTLHEPEIVTLTDADNPKLHIEGFRDLRPYCESENPDLLILSQSKPNIYTNLIPDQQLILPKGDIQFKMLDKVLSFNMTATEQNKGLIRVIFSVDSGETWQTYDEGIQDFKEIIIQDLDVVRNEGMTVPVFNSIGERWNDIVKQNKIRFGYYLKIEELADVAEVDKLDVIIDALGSWDATLHEVDYDYEYDNEKIYIELYRDGSYKINYI
ncbi:discoidin domain-containing protein [Tissierella sp.]|uniref:discoidin domain-containing protein n=1 Tax=Tissierella sp. TaxID=41274 RepID=UPI00303C9B41